MDEKRFDALTRTLARGRSRRAALTSLAGGVLAAAFARLGHATAAAPSAAVCKAKNKKCDKNTDCCSKLCKAGKCRCRTLRAPCDESADCCQGRICLTSNGCNDGKRCRRKNGETCASKCDCATGIQCKGGKCCNPEGAVCLILGQPQLCCPGLICGPISKKCELPI